MARFEAVHPVVDVRDVLATANWFCLKLGFEPLFFDEEESPNYGGVGRDGIEVHLQWHSAEEWESMTGSAYRFLVDDPDALFEEYRAAGVQPPAMIVADTTWGTREFGLYDPNGNALFFYCNRSS